MNLAAVSIAIGLAAVLASIHPLVLAGAVAVIGWAAWKKLRQ